MLSSRVKLIFGSLLMLLASMAAEAMDQQGQMQSQVGQLPSLQTPCKPECSHSCIVKVHQTTYKFKKNTSIQRTTRAFKSDQYKISHAGQNATGGDCKAGKLMPPSCDLPSQQSRGLNVATMPTRQTQSSEFTGESVAWLDEETLLVAELKFGGGDVRYVDHLSGKNCEAKMTDDEFWSPLKAALNTEFTIDQAIAMVASCKKDNYELVVTQDKSGSRVSCEPKVDKVAKRVSHLSK